MFYISTFCAFGGKDTDTIANGKFCGAIIVRYASAIHVGDIPNGESCLVANTRLQNLIFATCTGKDQQEAG